MKILSKKFFTFVAKNPKKVYIKYKLQTGSVATYIEVRDIGGNYARDSSCIRLKTGGHFESLQRRAKHCIVGTAWESCSRR